jgi:5-methylcytosine-specific restriction endonuclease McrA
MKLTIELVPKTAWYSNVRSNVSKTEWDKIRKQCYAKADFRCEICGGVGNAHPVECHEIWEYDDDKHIQTLKGLISLCPTCHKVKHSGLARLNGEENLIIKQLMQVNNMTRAEAAKYIDESFYVWSMRNAYDWQCNIDYLKTL